MKRTPFHSLHALWLLILMMGVMGSAAAESNNGIPGQIQALIERVKSLENQVTSLKAALACVSTSSNASDLYFEGCNVHVRNHTGHTDSVDGYGNLIIGYNENENEIAQGPESIRTGSHNLIVGRGHSYSSYGGLVAGERNHIMGSSTSISGGDENTASAHFSSVGGGHNNTASGVFSSVSGGENNTASGETSVHFSSVSGGHNNTASGVFSSVSGGENNTASGDFQTLP